MSRRGLTLIELLIATVIVSLGVVGLLAVIPVLSATGARVETRIANDMDAASIAGALRLGARSHTHVRWGASRAGARTPSAVFMLLPHAAAASTPPADPEDPGVFGDRGCLVLPYGSDKAFVYPRAGDAAAIRRDNADGVARRAAENLPASPGSPPEALYRLHPGSGTERARSAFALRVQRASDPDGRKHDGLYLITILLYRGSGDDLRSYTLTEQLPLELTAGPTDQDVLVPGGPHLHPHDWSLAADASAAAAAAAGRPR